MIKKKYNPFWATASSLLCVPVFVGLLMIAGKTGYAQVEQAQSPKKSIETLEKDRIFENATIGFETDNGIIYKDYGELSKEEKGRIKLPPPPPPPPGKSLGDDLSSDETSTT